jgi:hypothetical protein
MLFCCGRGTIVMTIYERPTKSLMTDWTKEALKPGQTFTKDEAARWFAQHYPKIKGSTVQMHVEVMSINNHLRKHYPNIKPGSGHDLFYKLGPDEFRLWKQDTDPDPCYKQDFDKQISNEDKAMVKATKGGEISLKEIVFGTREVAAKILELSRQSNDGFLTYEELWWSFLPDFSWSGNSSQKFVTQSLFRVIGYCVRYQLPIITVLVVRATDRRLSAEAVQNIYQKCKELGVETGPHPEAFVSDQIKRIIGRFSG